jgi:hypothetical protein
MKCKQIFGLLFLAVIYLTSCNKQSVIEGYEKISAPIEVNKSLAIRPYNSNAWVDIATIKVGPSTDQTDLTLRLYSYLKVGLTGNVYTTTDSVWVSQLGFYSANVGAAYYGVQHNVGTNGVKKFSLNEPMPAFQSFSFSPILFSAKRSIPYASNVYNMIGANANAVVQGNYFSSPSFWYNGVAFGDEFFVPFYVISASQKSYYGWLKVRVERNAITVLNYYYSASPSLKVGALK